MIKIDILTLFPEMFDGPFSESIIKRAKEKNLVRINLHNLREWAEDKHKTVDDRPYGGGPGMILRVDIIDKALKSLITNHQSLTTKIILLDAGGQKFTQKKALSLSKLDRIILICGHYEGIDHRVHEHLVDETISIGNYVLTGGEIPAMVITDTVTRLVPGVIKEESLIEESFSDSLKIENLKLKINKEYPQYTRPENYNDWKVPEVLLSGNHKDIINWKQKNQSSPAKS